MYGRLNWNHTANSHNKNVLWETSIKSKHCYKTTLSFWSVADSLKSLVFQSLIRDKGRFPLCKHKTNWNNYRLIIAVSKFSVSHLLDVLFIKSLITDKQDKICFALLSLNWRITDVFMTHELFIHLDSIQVVCLCLSSLPRGVPLIPFCCFELKTRKSSCIIFIQNYCDWGVYDSGGCLFTAAVSYQLLHKDLY